MKKISLLLNYFRPRGPALEAKIARMETLLLDAYRLYKDLKALGQDATHLHRHIQSTYVHLRSEEEALKSWFYVWVHLIHLKRMAARPHEIQGKLQELCLQALLDLLEREEEQAALVAEARAAVAAAAAAKKAEEAKRVCMYAESLFKFRDPPSQDNVASRTEVSRKDSFTLARRPWLFRTRSERYVQDNVPDKNRKRRTKKNKIRANYKKEWLKKTRCL